MSGSRGPGRPADADPLVMRERLVAACWDALVAASSGGVGVSVARICSAAGCSPPTLYHHFGSLAELQRTTSERAFARWAGALERDIEAGSSPAARLLARGRAYLTWGIEHPAAYRTLFLSPSSGQPQASTPGHGFDPLVADVADLLGLDAGDPLVLTAAFAHWSAVHGLTCLAMVHPDLPAELVQDVLEHLSAALTRRP